MRALAVIFILLPFIGFSQRDFSGGVLPRINTSFKLTERLKLNSSLELRQQLFDKELTNDKDADFILADLANTFSYKLASNQKLNIGYTIRNRNQEFHHRFTQQFSLVQQKSFFRLGHRFGLDQTFIPDEDFVFRTRYRISIEKPLSGTVVDEKEFYLKVNNEYLGIFTQNNADIELRLIPYIGYEINSTNKIEIGLDYRVGDFTRSQYSHRAWLSMVYYATF